MITYQFTFHLQDARVFDSDMELVSGDVGAYSVDISFLDNKKVFDLSGYTFSIRAVRADETVLTDAGTIEDNRATYTLKNAMYAVPGDLLLEFALSDEKGNYATTKIVRATVLAGAGEGNAVQDDTNTYVTLLARMTERLQRADALLTALDIDLTDIRAELEKKADSEEVETVLSAIGETMNQQQKQLEEKADSKSVEGALLHKGRVGSFDEVPENTNHVYAVGGKLKTAHGLLLDLFTYVDSDVGYQMSNKFLEDYADYIANEDYRHAYLYNPDGTYVAEVYADIYGGTPLTELLKLYSPNNPDSVKERLVTFYVSPAEIDFCESGAAFYDREELVKLPSEMRVAALEHSLGAVDEALDAILAMDDAVLGGVS